MSATARTEITLIQTVPTASRLGTVNGMPVLDQDWHNLRREFRNHVPGRANRLATAGVREVEVHQGRTIFTLRTPAGTMDTMARAVISHLTSPEQIRTVWAQPPYAVVRVDSPDGTEIYEVLGLYPDTN